MVRFDAIIVGGGPAGAACAWRLRRNDVNCVILDRQGFPRAKPCAGWITPEVLQDLELRLSDYPYGFTSFTAFQVSLRGLKFKVPTRQHAIRRFEFDDWLPAALGGPRSAAQRSKHCARRRRVRD